MKRFLMLIITLSLFGGGMLKAQHLTFKGVPITGTLKEFTNAMIQKGFHHELTQDGLAVFSGDFAGYKDCSFWVITLQNQDVVNQVTVLFSEHETWSSLITQYNTLKLLLAQKYGAPADNMEVFTAKYPPSDDYFKISALHSEEYIWYTSFETAEGEIRLSLGEGISYHTGRVRLVYFDKTNTDKVRQAAFDDL